MICTGYAIVIQYVSVDENNKMSTSPEEVADLQM